MKILTPPTPEKPRYIIEIRIAQKDRPFNGDRRTYYYKAADTILITDISLEETYDAILNKLKEMETLSS